MLTPSEDKATFIKLFNGIARHRHRYEVFRDFVLMSAISIHNAINRIESLEAEYMEIVGHYDKHEASDMAKLLACLVELLEPEPSDVLGQLYMELNLGNENTGQFFTPPTLSELCAQMLYGDELKNLSRPFVKLSEPACGAGGMVLAFTKVMIQHGHNPSEKLWTQCIDIDRVAAMMCYLQLSLWNVPAQIIVGNTLSWKLREQYFTPAHYLGGWGGKLRLHAAFDQLSSILPESKQSETHEEGTVIDIEVEPIQIQKIETKTKPNTEKRSKESPLEIQLSLFD